MLEHIAQPAPADAAEEYVAATTTTAIFDHSDFAKIVLTGPDVPMFLGNLSTNDIKNLPVGGGCESYFCDARAKALFHTAIFHVLHAGAHAFWLETVPGRGEALFKHLDRYLISEAVEIEDVTEKYAQYFLSGPTSRDMLDSLFGGPVPESDFQNVVHDDMPDSWVLIHRRDWLGTSGYEIVCPRASDGFVWQELTAAGAVPAGEETFHTLRVEAGRPFYGIDIDENRFVMEVGGAENAVSYTKGCYLGQEPIVMARDRAGHAPRSFVQLKFPQGIELPSGSKLFLGADEIGVVTSACQSPRWQATLALGYVKWKHREPGTTVEAEMASGRVAGEELRV